MRTFGTVLDCTVIATIVLVSVWYATTAVGHVVTALLN